MNGNERGGCLLFARRNGWALSKRPPDFRRHCLIGHSDSRGPSLVDRNWTKPIPLAAEIEPHIRCTPIIIDEIACLQAPTASGT
jgi:hypothetical protein